MRRSICCRVWRWERPPSWPITSPSRKTSARHTGLIVGIRAFGNLFAAGFLPFAGMVRDGTGSFAPIFLLVGLAPFLGLAVLIAGWGRDPVEPVIEDHPA